MDQNFLKEIPKFKTPEEELRFLRQYVTSKEDDFKKEGIKDTRDVISDKTLEVYKSVPIEQVLRQDRIIPKEEVEGIVLRLKPEEHDEQIEELFSILIERGIKNALNVVAGMNNPHLSDDFHRFLVQYITAERQIKNLDEKTEVFKALNMKLFEVTLPEDKDQKNFKDFLGSMEQFYAGMLSVSRSHENYDADYFTIEIALSNSSDDVVIYVAIPTDKTDLFEKQILAFYQKAKVIEVTDDYNIFNSKGASSAAYATLAEHSVYPIKTYDTIGHDPVNSILNVFSKLKTIGEGASIQLVITPSGDKFIKGFNSLLDKVKKGEKIDKNMPLFGDFNKELAQGFKKLIFGIPEKKEEKKIDDNAVRLITEKMKSTIVNTTIRIITSAETKDRSDKILEEIESAFNQFAEAGSNRFVFEKKDDKKSEDLFREFSFRLPNDKENIPLNLKELATVFHFPVGSSSTHQLKVAKAGVGPAPVEIGDQGIMLGVNEYQNKVTPIHMAREDRLRHMYVVGQTGTGKTTLLKNMIAQDIANGDGVCYIDPHGTDIQDILSYIPEHRIDDVIYFDPAYTARPMALNMLEYDPNYPEQKTFVVNELMSIFNKLFDMKVGGGAMFEQYFRNSAFLVMEDPESGSTLLEITRVLQDKAFRDFKLSKCKNPIIKQFWASAEATTGEQGLENFVPYISSKFDPLISNDIMRPVIAQQNSVFDFRKIMDEKKILLVNLSKGRLGEINANLIGMILVGKIQMAALSRVDMYGQKMNDFYLYIDEFQNVTTDSIASILSEARKYKLSLTVAHQYIAQLEQNIKNAVFGNVGSMAIYRVSPEDAEFLAKKLEPTFTANDITKLDNFNSYVNMLVNGVPVKPFSMTAHFSQGMNGNKEIVDDLKQLSYLKYGRDREEVEAEIMEKYKKV